MKRELELARSTVVDHELDEQVQDADVLGDEEQIPDGFEESIARWMGGAETDSR